ncbi:uncharacterized protein [Blastocystis hominis]|uniref:Heat shock protein 70 n=1 Tax=Blastocystis hominis TaxID=12968 RepID=D8M3L5_BLAHO|nr:uncharacterized protein [Blastocystis hominis]CBK22488.2 unnamed protein product [Blastocystis hominis]|eukprot:XP_012896536.1 uncharacterized protein [Blastocystis hominis]
MSAFCGGIDIGIRNSVITTYQKTGSDCVTTIQGRPINKNNEVSICESALPYMLSPTHFSIQYAKRVIGYQYNSERVLSNPDICIAKMREGRDGKVEFYKEGWEVTETPVSVYVKLMKHMLDRSEVYRVDYKQEQIADTEEAIRQVGFTKENYCLLKEPIAAAISYGLEGMVGSYTLVYDLNEDTFDCTIIQISDDVLKICGYGGNEKIGGLAFDETIRDWVIREVREVTPLEIYDSKSKDYQRRMQKLLRKCHEAKEGLVEAQSYEIDLSDIASEKVLEEMELIDLTRAKMDFLLSPFIRRTIEVIDNTIEKAGLHQEDIKRILMVGGSSRLRCVHSALTKHFGSSVSLKFNVNPDEVVALGAATFCHIWSESDHDFSIPFNGRRIKLVEGEMVVLAKNGDLMSREPLRKLLATPVDNAQCMRIEFYQGEKKTAEENVRLKCIEWSNFRSLPKGEVKFVLSLFYVNSLWECEVRDFYTKQIYVERQRI